MRYIERHTIVLLVLLIAQFLLVWVFRNSILFWDTVQFAGRQATHYYINGLDTGLLLPEQMDSGHPPVFALFLSLIWKWFGKSLMVSHLMMLPFVLGILYQAYLIADFLFDKYKFLFPVLLFVCPLYLGHSILVSPDLIVLLGFLLALRGCLMSKNLLRLIGVLLMCLVSTRGFAMSVALLGYEVFLLSGFSLSRMVKVGWRFLPMYLPGLIVFFSYQLFHYLEVGWIGYHENSPWAGSFELVSLDQMPRQVILFFRQYLEYGMILIVGIFMWRLRYSFIIRGRLVWLLFIVSLILLALTLPYVGLMNHRYFTIPAVVLLLLVAQMLRALNKPWLMVLCVVFLFLGNFWVYPKGISQSWDTTLGHVGFYQAEKEMKVYLQENNIALHQVGTAFPLRQKRKYLDLTYSNDGYKKYDLDRSSYILISTVMNEFSDEELTRISQMELLKSTRSGMISFSLYKNDK